MPKPTPSELRGQAPVVGDADAPSATDEELEQALAGADAAVTALAPVLALIGTPADNLADTTGGAATTDTDVEARAAVDAIKTVLVDAGLMAPEEEE